LSDINEAKLLTSTPISVLKKKLFSIKAENINFKRQLIDRVPNIVS